MQDKGHQSNTGKIEFWNEEKGFGFIVYEDGNRIFVHVSALCESVGELTPSEQVGFDIEHGDRGPKAVNVIQV